MPDNQDELLERARKLQEKAARVSEQNSAIKNRGPAHYVSTHPAIVRLMSFVRKLKRWLGPVGNFLGWLFGRVAAFMKFAAFRRQNGEYLLDEDGDLDFSIKRLISVSIMSLALVVLMHVALSALYFYSTYFHEMVYVTGKQEIETGEKYQFGGCTSLPCSTMNDNGKFYLIETSLYFPALFYPEEEVFANIPQQNGACKIEGYGIYFRSLRWLYKQAQLYQHVVDVSCRPYTEDEIRQAVESGIIKTGKQDDVD